MRNRQRIEEIVKRVGKDVPAELTTALGKIDRRLRGIGKPSPFVWDARVEAVYPRETYWYLYQRP
jgi:hypothetical protein